MADVMNCFTCGDDDHMSRDCPRNKAKVQPQQRSPHGVPTVWCSYCDEHTRLIDLGHSMQRCPNCHPLRFQQLKQGRKCPQCNKTVFEWDHASSCEDHAGPGLPLPRPAKIGRPESTRIGPPGPGPASPYPTCPRSPLGTVSHVPGCGCPPGSA